MIKNLQKQLAKVQEDLHEVKVKYSGMVRTPKSEPDYSYSKLEGWKRDIEKLEAKELELLQEIDAVKSSPEFVRKRDTALATIVARRNRITADLAKTKDAWTGLHYEMSQKIVDGADPLVLVQQEKDLQDKITLLGLAISALNGAASRIDDLLG